MGKPKVWVRPRPNRKAKPWVCAWEADGRRGQRAFATQHEAELFKANKVIELDAQPARPPLTTDRDVTVRAYGPKWLKDVAAGLKPIEVQYYDDDAVSLLAIQSGRADATFSVNATQAYQAARTGKTKLVGTVSGGWPVTAEIAVTTRKGSGLADGLTVALNKLVEDGTYAKVLKIWGLSSEAIDKSFTNPPGLPKPNS